MSVVHPLMEPLAAETAALLYAGDDTALSNETSAALLGALRLASKAAIPHVTSARHATGGPRRPHVERASRYLRGP